MRPGGVAAPADPRVIGTLNPKAFGLPVFQHRHSTSAVGQIASLTARADELKKSNQGWHDQLRERIQRSTLTVYERFLRSQMMLSERIAKREAELEDLASYFDSFRTSADPTFVEVSAARKTRYDSLVATLLVSNRQRSFFSNTDLVTVNSELTALIVRQRQQLQDLAANLKVFEDFDTQVYIPYAIQTLRKGDRPFRSGTPAPTKLAELLAKKKTLQGELSKLVNTRKELLKPEQTRKMKRRHAILMNAKATLIQSRWRGYCARKYIRRMKAAALKLTSVARGFLVRLRKSTAEGIESHLSYILPSDSFGSD
jgi:hypothetical protein